MSRSVGGCGAGVVMEENGIDLEELNLEVAVWGVWRNSMKKIDFLVVGFVFFVAFHIFPERVNARERSIMKEEMTFRTGMTGKGGKFSVSPDGGFILFGTGKLSDGLKMLDVKSQIIKPVSIGSGYSLEMPRWSADGEMIVAAAAAIKNNQYSDDGMKIIVMHRSSMKWEDVDLTPGVKVFPFFSKDGEKIFYFKGVSRKAGGTLASHFDLYSKNLSGSQEEKITNEEFYQVSRGADDGVGILFGAIPGVRKDNNLNSKGAQSVLLKETKGRLTKLLGELEMPADLYYPNNLALAPDGGIYFVAARIASANSRYEWFLFKSNLDNHEPLLIRRLDAGMGFDVAQKTGDIYIMRRVGEEIVFDRIIIDSNMSIGGR